MKELSKCNLCPLKCNVDRNNGMLGRCRAGKKIKIALASLHFYEEPCISGKSGSGTVFFTGCNLSCVFCQNYEVSQNYKGEEIDIEKLADTFLDLQNKKANNINLVTGFMFAPHIVEAVKIAKEKGLKIPIVYNSSGYESVDTIKMLEGTVDVYLPDFKYYYNELGEKYSGVKNYFENSTEAIKEMIRQKGAPSFDENGLIKKGVIIRHLILPNHIRNTKRVLKYIKDTFGKDTYVSIMAQYFPTNRANEYEEINRKISKEEYDSIEEYIEILGLKNGYMQDFTEEDESKYVPNF